MIRRREYALVKSREDRRRGVLRQLPKLRVGLVEAGPPTTDKQRRRNRLVERELALKQQRIVLGREERARRTEAALVLQRFLRSGISRNNVGNAVEELRRRLAVEGNAAKRTKDDKLRVLALERLRVGVLSANLPEDAPLRRLVLAANTFRHRFDLELPDGWQGQQELVLQALTDVLHCARSVVLCKCRFGKRGGQLLADALVRQTQQLRRLCLSDCRLDAHDLHKVLSSVKFASPASCRRLDLTKNWLGRGKWVGAHDDGRPAYEERLEAAAALADLLRSAVELEELDVGRNFMGPRVFRSIVGSKAFSCPRPALVRLDVSWNGIGDPGGSSALLLAHVVKMCPALRHLDVEGNALAANGLKQMAEALSLHKALTTLNLSSNKLLERGAVVAGQILEANRALQRLGLANNDMGTAGIATVAQALTFAESRGEVSLQELDLSGNRLGAVAADRAAALDALATMTQRCTNLCSLALRDVGIVSSSPKVPKERRGEIHDLFQDIRTLVRPLSQRQLHLYGDVLPPHRTLRIDLRGNHLEHPVNAPVSASLLIQQLECDFPGLHVLA